MKRSHQTMLIVGVVLIAVGCLLPLLALTGVAEPFAPASTDGLAALWIAFWALAIGIPLSAVGCVLSAVAVVAHRYPTKQPPMKSPGAVENGEKREATTS